MAHPTLVSLQRTLRSLRPSAHTRTVMLTTTRPVPSLVAPRRITPSPSAPPLTLRKFTIIIFLGCV